MQRATQAPQPASFPPKYAPGPGNLRAFGSHLSVGVLSSIFKLLKSKGFFAAVNISPSLPHLQPLNTAFRWVQRCYLLRDNPVLPTKGTMDNVSEYIPKPSLMLKVLHPTPPNYSFCP